MDHDLSKKKVMYIVMTQENHSFFAFNDVKMSYFYAIPTY